MHGSITLLRYQDGSPVWYMASIATHAGKTAIGFGTTHFAALQDAIASITKTK